MTAVSGVPRPPDRPARGTARGTARGASRARRLWLLFVLLVMSALWGLQFVMLKLTATAGYAEVSVLTLSLVILSAVFLLVLALRRELFRPRAGQVLFFTIGSLLGYVLPLGAVLAVAADLPAGLISFMVAVTPVVTVLVALLLRTEAVSPARVLAVIAGALAILLVFWADLRAIESDYAWALLILLLAPLAYGVDSIYIDRFWPEGLSALQVVTGEVILASLVLLPFYAIHGEPLAYDPAWPAGQWGFVVFTAAGIFEVFLFFYFIQQTGGVLVSFGSFIALFAGIGWGAVLFAERLGLEVWLAVALLCGALLLVALDKRGITPN